MKLAQALILRSGMVAMLALICTAATTGFAASHRIQVLEPASLNANDSEVVRMDALIQRGVGLHTIMLFSEQSPAELTIWQYGECRPFGILGVRYLETPISTEWKDAAVRVSRDIAYFNIPTKFVKLQLRTQSNEVFAFNCSLSIRKAESTIPSDLIQILAKLKAPECSTDQDGRATCKFAIDRIDGDSIARFIVLERDVKKFSLQAGRVYQLTGFVEDVNGTEVFLIEGAKLIQ